MYVSQMHAACLERDVRGNSHDVARVRRCELRIAAAAEQREHAFARGEPRHSGAGGRDRARGLEAEDR